MPTSGTTAHLHGTGRCTYHGPDERGAAQVAGIEVPSARAHDRQQCREPSLAKLHHVRLRHGDGECCVSYFRRSPQFPGKCRRRELETLAARHCPRSLGIMLGTVPFTPNRRPVTPVFEENLDGGRCGVRVNLKAVTRLYC